MKKQQNSSWLISLCSIQISGLLACSGSDEASTKKKQKPDEQKIRTVAISTAQFQETGIELGGPDTLPLGEQIQATGKLEAPPDQWANVHALINGSVRSTRLVEEDFVQKGQALAMLEHPDYIDLQQEYLQAIARNRFEKQELDRQTELDREEVGARRKLQ